MKSRPSSADCCVIEIKDLSTKWPADSETNKDYYTLTDLSLTVRTGQLLAVVGQVGAGKVN